MAEDVLKSLGANPTRKEILAKWDPENEAFWKKFGEPIAKQNLYTSTWALTLSFVVWTLWATIAAQLNRRANFHACIIAGAGRRDVSIILHVHAGLNRR